MTILLILVALLNAFLNLLPCSAVSETCSTSNKFKDADTVFEYGDKCAAVIDDEKNWTESRDLCRGDGGELLKISTQADMDRLVVGLGERENCFWIGLNDRDHEGEFRWSDGTPTDLQHLFPPSSVDDEIWDCVYVCRLKPGPWKWISRVCSFPHKRVCEFERFSERITATVGESPATTTVGESPATTTVGESPAKTTVGESPATTTVGESPTTTTQDITASSAPASTPIDDEEKKELQKVQHYSKAVSETCNASKKFKNADTVFEYGGKCAAVFDDEKSWTESRDLCRGDGGELVKISTQADMDRLTVGLGERENCVWIGLSDRDEEGEFRWSDGTPTELQHLLPPSSVDDEIWDCVYMCRLKPAPWKWISRVCSFPYKRVCEFERFSERITATVGESPATTTVDESPATTTVGESPATTTVGESRATTTVGESPTTTTQDITASSAPASMPVDEEEKREWQKAEYFSKVNLLEKHPYLSADPILSFSTHSLFACCGECAGTEGCVVVNINLEARSCRLFTSLTSLSQGHEDVPGWVVFAMVK